MSLLATVRVAGKTSRTKVIRQVMMQERRMRILRKRLRLKLYHNQCDEECSRSLRFPGDPDGINQGWYENHRHSGQWIPVSDYLFKAQALTFDFHICNMRTHVMKSRGGCS